jgi:hypothetical protein
VLRWRGLGAASRRRGSGTISTRGSGAVVRADDYIGAAIACRFAREVFSGVCGRRSGDKLAPPIAEIEAEVLAPLEATVFNVGANVNFPVLETTERVFRKVWELARYAGFLTGREAARFGVHLLHRGYRQHARRHRLRRLRQRQIRASGRPCRRSSDRCRGRHRLGARTDRAARRRGWNPTD